MLQRQLRFAQEARRPLQLQSHKPIPIATYAPKFSMSGSSGSGVLKHAFRGADADPARQAAGEMQRLRREVRETRRGAMRELRRDARFLADVQRTEQRNRDAAYARAMGRVQAELEHDRAEARAEERERERARRRAGGKR